MKAILESVLRNQFQLDEDLVQICSSKFEIKTFKKKDYFLHCGDVCNKIAFINKGLMYCVYNKDGDNRVDEFSFEGRFITDYLSFLTGMPSDKDIVCLEDCEILVIEKQHIEEVYSINAQFERMGRFIAEGLFINWHMKSKSLAVDNAETRYLKLISERPDLTQRVPQYLIASYLNVTPETISRIRKKALQTPS